ncbi:hypothetical protein FBU30_007249 [Linnemannia zychae]|nr:hypothetical protein FBU30_007249 [Linnemannia zychae]
MVVSIIPLSAFVTAAPVTPSALKCTWYYKSSSSGKRVNLSDPREGVCISFQFQAYEINNRCSKGATIYVDNNCDGNSWHIEAGEDYKGRHDIYKSIKFD